ENVYNMDETSVMLSMLNSVKVLVSKDNTHAYRGARVKRTIFYGVLGVYRGQFGARFPPSEASHLPIIL
ncbi:hypothetical protein BDV95DRAFT_497756, partial [Massariosphaeria phaeospora]